jgi:hypothetical protein
VSHDKPKDRASWAAHGEIGWYLGPALEHYRCHKVYITKTRSERASDTVEFFPQAITMPHMSSADAATLAAQDLTHTLLHPAPAAPFATLSNTQAEAIAQLAEIFRQVTPRPRPPRLLPPPADESPIPEKIPHPPPRVRSKPNHTPPIPVPTPTSSPRVPRSVAPDAPVPPPRVVPDDEEIHTSAQRPLLSPLARPSSPTILPPLLGRLNQRRPNVHPIATTCATVLAKPTT